MLGGQEGTLSHRLAGQNVVHPTQGLTKYQGEGTGHCPWSGWESAGWLEYSRVTGMGRRGGGELPLPWVLYTLAMEPGPSCGGGGSGREQ